MTEQRENLAASVRQRLLNHSGKTKQDFQVVLARYAFERILYRLGQSPSGKQFTLKGALLFLVWTGEQYRPTRDLDLMSEDTRTEAELEAIFREVCALQVTDDGIVFLDKTVTVEPIRDDNEYGGMRVNLTAELAQARIPVQIDIGFADAITPDPVETEFPALLEFAADEAAFRQRAGTLHVAVVWVIPEHSRSFLPPRCEDEAGPGSAGPVEHESAAKP